MSSRSLVGLAALCCLGFAAPVLALTYRVTVIGIPAGFDASATRSASDEAFLVTVPNSAFLWDEAGRFVRVAAPVAWQYGYLNARGEVALYGKSPEYPFQIGFLWDEANGHRVIPAPFGEPTFQLHGLSDVGQIVGVVQVAGQNDGFFQALDGDPVVLPRLPGTLVSAPRGLNNRGMVVGVATPQTQAFVWTEGLGSRRIDVPGSTDSRYAFHVSDDGFIAGAAGFGAVLDPWVLPPGEALPFRVRGSTDRGWDIPGMNQMGHLAGVQRGAPFGRRATVWVPGWSRGRDLRSMVDASIGDWGLRGAYCINNKGQIGVTGQKSETSPVTALLLTPHSLVSPVGSLAARAGRVESGGTAQLLEEDGAFVRARRGLSPTSVAAPLALEASATVAERPLYLWVRATLRSADGAPLAVRARLWDWVEGRWDSDPFRSDAWAVGGEWSRNELVARRDPGARYRGPLGEVRVRLDASGPPTAPWALDLDRLDVEWVARPPD